MSSSEPRTIRAPKDVEDVFLRQAEENTLRDVETCGLLCGEEERGVITLTHLLMPPQRGTANTVEMLDDTRVGMYIIDNGLQVLGWIHTHPSQSAFLSSVDLHTQHTYQALLPEAVAVVCAPTYGISKWLRLTPAGMSAVEQCTMRGFHQHATRHRLFQSALNIIFQNSTTQLIDRRTGSAGSPENPPHQEPPKPQRAEAAEVDKSHAIDQSDVRTEAIPSDTVSNSKIRRLEVKLEKYLSHNRFLDSCVREKLIPKGFEIKWACHFGDYDEVKILLHSTSLELVRICAEKALERINRLKTELTTIWRAALTNLSQQDVKQLKGQVSLDRERVRIKLAEVKNKKLSAMRAQAAQPQADASSSPLRDYHNTGKAADSKDYAASTVPGAATTAVTAAPLRLEGSRA